MKLAVIALLGAVFLVGCGDSDENAFTDASNKFAKDSAALVSSINKDLDGNTSTTGLVKVSDQIKSKDSELKSDLDTMSKKVDSLSGDKKTAADKLIADSKAVMTALDDLAQAASSEVQGIGEGDEGEIKSSVTAAAAALVTLQKAEHQLSKAGDEWNKVVGAK